MTKTYVKLPKVEWETQMYTITETQDVIDTTTRENFVSIIEILNQQKTEFNTKIDAEIADNEATLAEIDKL